MPVTNGASSRNLHSLAREELIELVERQALMIAQLQEQVQSLREELAETRKEGTRSARRIAELEERLRTNSGNSSKPPSSDGPAAGSKPTKPPTGRKAGGQPGHEGSRRQMLPPEQVDQLKHEDPKRCGHCRGRNLHRTDSPPRRHQVTEVPPIRPETTEWQMHEGLCADCGCTTWAGLPEGVPTGAFGPRAVAIASQLTGDYNLSRRRAVEAMKDLFGVEMALGTMTACEQQVSAALARPVEQAHEAAVQQPIAHVDETGWKQRLDAAGKRRHNARSWLWVMATPLVTIFLVHSRRGIDAAQKLMGAFAGYLITDRWHVYNRWGLWMRQLCWAHLIRDFTKISERRGGSKRIGKDLLARIEKMFEWWHRVRDGTIQFATFRKYMHPVRGEIEALLAQGAESRNARTRATCREVLKLRPALWTFIDEPGVGIEPTNNTGERRIRRGVMWRRTSFGTHSDAGSRYVERLLTTTTTLRQQGRNVLAFLHEALVNKLHGRPAPSLLPTGPVSLPCAEAA
jgi:transposase